MPRSFASCVSNGSALDARFPDLVKKELKYDIRVENELLRRHAEVLTNLAKRASENVQLEDFLQETSAQVAQAIEIDHVKVMRYRPDRGDLFTEAGVGWRPGVVKTTAFPADMGSPPGRSFQTAQPVMVESMPDSTEFRSHTVLKEHGIQSLLNVPILVNGSAWGVLEADSSILRGFSEDTVNFLVSCATLIAVAIRRAEAEEARAAAMADTAREAHKRTLMFTELQHRVKNNFQTILAMISLQLKKFPTDEGRRIAQKISDNVRAMSLAHDQLAANHSGAIELRSYLEALVTSIGKPFENITIEVEAEDMTVGIEQAVPIGLIVNEAVTNAVKHAFTPKTPGAIRIILRPHGTGEAKLEICDNGKGAGEIETSGSGQALINALAKQVRGRISLENSSNGLAVSLIFPRPGSALRPL